jgi:redox-sensitive bicupin YhaK (pirin superfamily)
MTTAARTPVVDVRRAGDRYRTRTAWLDSRHSFSFGPHYDAGNTSHGLLLVHNEDVVAAGGGFDLHPHRDMEIVTWVLAGSLVHEDSEGNRGTVVPGLAQRMSAGSGVRHSERNEAGEPVRFVQMWVAPDTTGGAPGYQQSRVDADALAAGLLPVASGMPRYADVAAVRIQSSAAALHVARLQPEQAVQLPDAPFLHLFVARGAVTVETAGALGTGDAARVTGGGGQRLTATAAAEVLLWEMHRALNG